ncbi:MAG TPA: S-methyl-5-thioribose-1-phosphate isomerase [Candidatus Tumulicola sp.]
MSELVPVRWLGDAVEHLDQRALPAEIIYRQARNVDDVVEAIATLSVRGAPCIGVFAAYGIAMLKASLPEDRFAEAASRVRAARPTAVNLAWAVDRVSAAPDALAAAETIAREQSDIDERIGRSGLDLIPDGAGVITHCNTGALATGGHGTALEVILAAHRAGKRPRVFVDETRPLLQGARLNYLELDNAGVDVRVIVDGAAAFVMQREGIACAIVGADRIARNGDTANKIGTYSLAVAAAYHGIPFYVAAPKSTFDGSIASGAQIPIEIRSDEEVTSFRGVQVAPPKAHAFNPAFDVTPAALIAGIVTEFGVLRSPYETSIAELLA